MKIDVAFFQTLMKAYTLFLYPVYHSQFRAILETERAHRDESDPMAQRAQLHNSGKQWPSKVETLHIHWKGACGALVVMLQVSIALLQIDTVLCNVFLRTSAVAIGVFSLTGLAVGGLFLGSAHKMSEPEFLQSWTLASRAMQNSTSIDFWLCLALPVVLVLWAVILCAMMLLRIIWIDRDFVKDVGNCTSGFGFIGSVTVTTLLAGNIILVGRAARLVWLQ